MIAGAFASVNFLFGLFGGHTGIDPIDDLALRQAGVFQAGNFRAGHDRLALQMAMQNELHGRVREADELQRDGIYADGVELIGARHLEDLRLGESGAREIRGGLRAGEEMFANVRGADQFDAGVVADSRVL